MDLFEILQHCPVGTKLYSPIVGEVELVDINSNYEYPIQVAPIEGFDTSALMGFTRDGLFYKHYEGECVLFPSKDKRDWEGVDSRWFRNNKTNTFKPFDKILVRNTDNDLWTCDLFSHINCDHNFPYATGCGVWKQCIPYEGNEHLVGTSNSD